MKSKTVVFDCDDVLANLRDPLEGLVSEHIGKKVSWKDWNQYEIGKVYGFDFKPICQMLVDRKTLENLKPDEAAAELIHWYRNRDYKVVVLTARGYHPRGREITQQWMIDNQLHVDDVVCIGLKENKRDYLSLMGYVENYIEDNHHHAEQAHGLPNVKEVYLLDRPWNQQISGATRVSCLRDVLSLKTHK